MNEGDPQINSTNELETFRAEVQAFLKESLTPDLIAARRYMTSVYSDYETGLAWQRKLYDKGWLVPSWPKEYGGTGWSLSQRHVFETELARAGAPPIFSQDYEQCEVVFENVRVPKTALVGQEHEGWAVTKYLLEFERGSKPSAPRLYQQLERVGHLIEGGANHRRAAELRVRVDGIDAMELNYLNQIEQTGSPGPGSSVLKIQSTELSQEISAFAMEVAAYYGPPYQPEVISKRDAANAVGPEEFLTIAPFYFNNRAASIYAGSNEIQRNIIAKAVLGL